MTREARKNVIFIGGSGRSGSTLLEGILAQLDGFVAVGEVNEIWKAGVLENRLCGCGRAFKACDFWTSVMNASFGTMQRCDLEEMLRLRNSVGRIRMIPQLANLVSWGPRYEKDVAAYCDVYMRLLDGIAAQAGAQTIVDSSKTPAHAYMLRMLPGIDLHIVHLVRDSRAVAYSWQRKKQVPGAIGERAYMVQMSPIRSALDWDLRNGLIGTLGGSSGKSIKSYSVLKYEDFVADAEDAVAAIAGRVGCAQEVGAIFESPDIVTRRRTTHTIEGNPSKFRHGDIEIRTDEEWRDRMRTLDKCVVGVLTAPYLRHFGYF